ncbi:MAG: hypothetical protein LBH95_10140 [Oscillospiraceae bacterium]|nr:hypothetical protein [Oscillospiraceae bacterium]
MRQFFRHCKCAIYILLLFLQVQHGRGYFPQTHFRYVAGSKAEGVYRVSRVKIDDWTEVRQIPVGVDAAAGQQHICHAAVQDKAVFIFNIFAVKSFKYASVKAIHQVGQIIGHIVLDGVSCRRYEGVGQRGFVL